jgi:hypothetical protein
MFLVLDEVIDFETGSNVRRSTPGRGKYTSDDNGSHDLLKGMSLGAEDGW